MVWGIKSLYFTPINYETRILWIQNIVNSKFFKQELLRIEDLYYWFPECFKGINKEKKDVPTKSLDLPVECIIAEAMEL